MNADSVKTNRNGVKIIYLPLIRDIREQAFTAHLSDENSIKISIEHLWTDSDKENEKF